MWSSVGGTPYPISLRVLSFENLYSMVDVKHDLPIVKNYAYNLKKEMNQLIDIDVFILQIAEDFKQNQDFMTSIQSDTGVWWKHIERKIEQLLPENILGESEPFKLVSRVLNLIFQDNWYRDKSAIENKTYVKIEK